MINCRISNGDKKPHQCVLTVEWEFRQKPPSLVTSYGLGWVRRGPINGIRTKSQLYLLSPGSQIPCNNVKNVLLAKRVELTQDKIHQVQTGSVSLNPSLSRTLSLSGQWSVKGRGWCHLVHLLWQFDIDPMSPDLTTQLSCHGRIQIRKMSNAVCIFFSRNISFNGIHSCVKGLFETRDVSLEKWSIPAVFNVPGYGVIGEAIWGSNKT